MMGLDDRLSYLLLGMLVGFVLGYITKALREIKEEIGHVDETVKRQKNERSFMRFPLVADAMLLVVLGITVYAAFSSQKTNNELSDTQDYIARITFCNQEYLAGTIAALNERTTYSTEQARANVKLQIEQGELLAFLLTEPPPLESEGREALRDYFQSGVQNFILVNERALEKFRQNPYPTEDELQACLENKD